MKDLWKNFTVGGLALVLLIEFIIAWRLDLPLGWPRYIAALVIVATFIGICVASVKAYNKKP